MKAESASGTLFICHECDALQKVPTIIPGHVASCVCCGSLLFKSPRGGIEKPLALMISSLILFFVANVYPIMTLNIAGIETKTTLTGSARIFIEQGSPVLAAIVWLSCVLIPGFIIFGLLYVLLSVRYKLGWRYTKQVLVWVSRMQPWGMMDVFLLGILVSLVKLVALADIILGPGFYAFVGLIILYAAATASLELHLLWASLDERAGETGRVNHGS